MLDDSSVTARVSQFPVLVGGRPARGDFCCARVRDRPVQAFGGEIRELWWRCKILQPPGVGFGEDREGILPAVLLSSSIRFVENPNAHAILDRGGCNFPLSVC